MDDHKTSVPFTFDSSIIENALKNIQSRQLDTRTQIDKGLFSEVNRILANGIDIAYDDKSWNGSRFKKELLTNTEVFAAFKAHRMGRDMASKLLDESGNIKPFRQFKQDTEGLVNHHVNAWLRTEYDTAIKRAHRASEMRQFIDEADVFPNIEWLPSTAVNPRESHMPFYHHIWPVGDPFWDEHKPGDEWGCQCGWQSTDSPVTDNTGLGGEGIAEPSPGLGGNPAKTGQVFSDDHPYFPSDCEHCGFYNASIKNRLASVFYNRKKDCYNCPYIKACIQEINGEKERIKENRLKYRKLKRDDNYEDVRFNKNSGGVVAVHKGHITHDGPKAERFFSENLTSTELEKECQEQLFKSGHLVILQDESKRFKGNQLPALDMMMDDILMDIRSVTGRGWYSNIFVKKNEQLRRFNARADIDVKADSLCLYFHNPELFDEVKMKKSINFFRFYRDIAGNLLDKDLKRVYCVIKGEDDVLVFDI